MDNNDERKYYGIEKIVFNPSYRYIEIDYTPVTVDHDSNHYVKSNDLGGGYLYKVDRYVDGLYWDSEIDWYVDDEGVPSLLLRKVIIMTREQAVEIWKDMYLYEVIDEYNHYVSDVKNFWEEEIFDIDELYDLVEDIPPMDLIKMVVYGDVRLTDDYVVVNKGTFIKTIRIDKVIDYVIENIDDDYLIDIAKEYQEDEDDD